MSEKKWNSRLFPALLGVFALLASLLLVLNTGRLSDEVDRQIKSYVSDVTGQMAKTVDNRLAQNDVSLLTVGDSLIRSGWEDQEETGRFLSRKAEICGFDSLMLLGTDGTLILSEGGVSMDYGALPGVQASLAGEEGVSVLPESRLLYSVPMYRDGQVAGVLGGVRGMANMQALIRVDGFFGEGRTCIVEKQGELVVLPEENTDFLELEQLAEAGRKGLSGDIRDVEADMAAGRSGVLRFGAGDGRRMVLSYEPLDHYSWFLLTLVPDNVFSGRIWTYMVFSYAAMTAVLLIMAVILLLFIRGRRKSYEQLRKAALTDPLTGGMNGAAFRIRCAEVVGSAPPGAYSLVLLNIRNFKVINDAWGKEEGDGVLRRVFGELKAQLKKGELAARSSADHFLLFLESEEHKDFTERLEAICRRAAQAAGRDVAFQAGVYRAKDPMLDPTIMQDRALAALQAEEAPGTGICRFYDSSIMDRLKQEQELEEGFEAALAAGAFRVYLQPKVGAKDGKLKGAEALVRWEHERRGLIPPSEFIPVFEKSEKILKLDLYVFTQVCRWQKDRMERGEPLIPVSVNLSRRHFQRPGCLEPFEEEARRCAIPRGLLEFELTESIFFDDRSIEDMKDWIGQMHRMGFLCSLDDFGSGYSSLGLLASFRVDAVKLDKRFFQDVSDPRVKSVVASVTALSEKLGAVTVAEGIEDEKQLAFARETGCSMVQGYCFSRPLPIAEFEKWALAKAGER